MEKVNRLLGDATHGKSGSLDPEVIQCFPQSPDKGSLLSYICELTSLRQATSILVMGEVYSFCINYDPNLSLKIGLRLFIQLVMRNINFMRLNKKQWDKIGYGSGKVFLTHCL